MKKNRNYWENVSPLTKEEYEKDIEDLGYDPLNQSPVGEEIFDFDEDILKDLVAKGYEGKKLIDKLHEIKSKCR